MSFGAPLNGTPPLHQGHNATVMVTVSQNIIYSLYRPHTLLL